MKVNRDLQLTEQTTDDYFRDMSDLIMCIHQTYTQHLTGDDQTRVLQTLKDVSMYSNIPSIIYNFLLFNEPISICTCSNTDENMTERENHCDGS